MTQRDMPVLPLPFPLPQKQEEEEAVLRLPLPQAPLDWRPYPEKTEDTEEEVERGVCVIPMF